MKHNVVRNFVFLILFLLAPIVIKAETTRYLIFETTEGVKISIVLSENPELTFNGQTMIITTNGKVQKVEIKDIAKWHYENETTGINTIESNNNTVINRTNENEIIVEGMSATSKVQVYSIDGKKQSAQVSYSDGGRAYINLSSLPKGVYIVSINKQQNIKIFKQ